MKKAICVYCASNEDISEDYHKAAFELGRLVALKGITLINGSGSEGLMRSSSDGALSEGGEVIGIIPQFMVDRDWCHKGLTKVVITKDMHERKQAMAAHADAAIALPGGVGTIEELMEVITWKSLGLYDKPIVILNVNGYYDPLLEMLDKAKKENFMKDGAKMPWVVAGTPEEAIEIIAGNIL